MASPSVFISYSHKDEIWKDRLRPHLGMLEKDGRLTIWDDRSIDGGATWYPEIKGAMEHAAVAVCLISADYLNSSFCVKEEVPYLLQRREHEGMLFLPVLIRPCLWEALDWLKAIQMMPRDGKSVAVDFKDNWDTPFADIAKQVNTFLVKPVRTVVVPPTPRWAPPDKVNIDRLPVTGAELFGRQNELKLLDDVWKSHTLNVISFVAWGGVGKSTLINKWREQLAADNYSGAKRVFAWSFYSQGTGERVTSADIFIAEALKWFGDPEMANSNASPWDKGQRLADLVRQEKTLLLLDGMEPLQSYLDFERGKIKDPALAVLVTELAKENPGLCVITTRENVADLADYPTSTQQIDLEQISAEAGRALLRVGGVQGTDAELEQAARDFGSHALAINLLSAYLHEIPGHHISNAAEIPDLYIPLKEGKHPRRVMAAFAKRFGESAEVDVLRILGLFSSPAESAEIAAVRAAPAIPNLTENLQAKSDAEWMELINRLRHLKLIAPESTHRPETLDAHPLVREHFGKQLKQEYPEAWKEGNNRLYEYYKTSAKEYPDTLEEMAPLFAAAMHGCQAGKYQEVLDEVFTKRIERKTIQFTNKNLGAFGAELAMLSNFYDLMWSKPVNGLREAQRSFVNAYVGYDLRALGRLMEAIQLMQASLKNYIVQELWPHAARVAENLSELYIIMGYFEQSLEYAKQGVELANKSGKWLEQRNNLMTYAASLHQAGRYSQSQAMFQKAENIQKQNQLDFPFLYSTPGFHYCDLLLSQGNYAEVQLRAGQTLKIANRYVGKGLSLFDIALDNLSLGRAHLLQSLHEPNHPFTEAITYLKRAVDGLRQAGTQHHLPHGLLARAEYYRITGDFDKAQKDLDEAFTISTRGGMGLHLADCHLGYDRLKVDKLKSLNASTALSASVGTSQPENLPTFKPDNLPTELVEAREHLKTAKEMIEKMGYHRRDKDVEEIEKQLA